MAEDEDKDKDMDVVMVEVVVIVVGPLFMGVVQANIELKSIILCTLGLER